MERATLWLEGGQIIIKAKYIKTFVDMLKQQIPAAAREWHADSKTWRVDASYADEAETIVRTFYTTEVVLNTFPSSVADALVKAVCGLTAKDRNIMHSVMVRAANNVHARHAINEFFANAVQLHPQPTTDTKHICIMLCKSKSAISNTIKIIKYVAQSDSQVSVIAMDGAGSAELVYDRGRNYAVAIEAIGKIGAPMCAESCDPCAAFVLAYYGFMPDNPHFLVLVDRPVLDPKGADEYIAEHWQGRRIDFVFADGIAQCAFPLTSLACKAKYCVGWYDATVLNNRIRSIDI